MTYVGHSDDLSAERFPFRHPRAACWVQRAGSRWKVYIATYEVPGGGRAQRNAPPPPGVRPSREGTGGVVTTVTSPHDLGPRPRPTREIP